MDIDVCFNAGTGEFLPGARAIIDGLDSYTEYSPSALMKPVKAGLQGGVIRSYAVRDDDNFFLQYIDGSENTRVQVGAKPKAQQAKALAYVRAHEDQSAEVLAKTLTEQGNPYSPSWCRNALRELKRGASSTNA